MSTMEQALRDALADLLTEAGYMAQQLAHRGLPGVPGDSVDRAIASAKAALTAALPAPGVEAPGDWVMVPVRHVEALMRRSVYSHADTLEDLRRDKLHMQGLIAAMLSAAPSAPAEISQAQAQAQAMREALEKLVHAAGVVHQRGAQTGPQWIPLAFAIVSARAALTPEPPR